MPTEDDHDEELEPEELSRPGWLPDNFRTPEALLESYKQAQDKIREQGTELNALAAQLEAARQIAAEAEGEPQRPDATSERPPGVVTMRQLAEQQHGRRQPHTVDPEATGRAVQQLVAQYRSPAAVSAEAEQLVMPLVPDWTELRGPVRNLIQGSSHWGAQASQAVAARDASQLASVYASAARTVAAADGVRAAKQAAQTLTGAGGAPERASSDEASWNRIVAAGASSYSELMAAHGR